MITLFRICISKAGYSSYQPFLLTALLLLLVPSVLSAQIQRQTSPSDSVSAEKSSPSDEQRSSGPIEDEMRVKRAIKFAENEHKENLDRAREVLALGEKLQTSYQFKKSLDREDSKRLDRLEKLTKQLRSKAGGSSTDETLENRPKDLADAISRIKDSSESLSKHVQKTPRQVVSATVIDEANVLLQLIEIVRDYTR